MKLRTAFLSTLFLFLAGAAMAVPTAGEPTVPAGAEFLAAWDTAPVASPSGYDVPATTPPLTAQYYPWPCPDDPFPQPYPLPRPWPFPSPWPGPTDQCIPNPFPF